MDTPPFTPVSREGFGWCYLAPFREQNQSAVAERLGRFAGLEDFLSEPDLEEDGDDFLFSCRLPGQEQVDFREKSKPYVAVPVECEGNVVAYHLEVSHACGSTSPSIELLRACGRKLVVGALFTDLAERAKDIKGAAEDYAVGVLARTNNLVDDAAANYDALGAYTDEVNARGGFAEISKAGFTSIAFSLIGRWASTVEAMGMARALAASIYESGSWDSSMIDEALSDVVSDEDKQERLNAIMGTFLLRKAGQAWVNWQRRKNLRMWKADLLGPAKGFAKAMDIDPTILNRATDWALLRGSDVLVRSATLLREHGLDACKVMCGVAAGGALAAGVVVAAGTLLDWYYDYAEVEKLGPERVSTRCRTSTSVYLDRLKQAHTIAAVISDESYDIQEYTNSVRVDPFFFTIKSEVGQLKDDSAANRMVSNAVLAPLLNTISTKDKNLILLPGTIPNESARHLQQALPAFYFKIVNRMHSHPALWATRRAFEVLVSKEMAASGASVAVVRGNARQVAKLPGVRVNFGPKLSGRDSYRKRNGGTVAQREYMAKVSVDTRFEDSLESYGCNTAVAFYTTHDIDKTTFLASCVRHGVETAYVTINIPLVFLDHRINEWEDHILGVRYVRRDGKITMAALDCPTSGYSNSVEDVLSWVHPIEPMRGYHVDVETLANVGSSYLLKFSIGAGPQEAYDVVWKMPDSGHYVLQDVTRNDLEPHYFTVPAQKFDQVVKFVVQNNGVKNLMEATTGRILGLEASIKLGGVTLERAWNLNHREFISVATHCLVCGNVDKGDALLMLGKLREAFTEKEAGQLDWRRGFAKLFGLIKDSRLPVKAKRAGYDYLPVTHWTSVQRDGVGWGEEFGGAPIETSADVAQKPSDEAYYSADDLNVEDGTSDTDSTASKRAGFIDLLSSWRVFGATKDKGVRSDFEGFGLKEGSKRLLVEQDELEHFTTGAIFNPEGPLQYEGSNFDSKATQLFTERFRSDHAVNGALIDGEEIPVPDSGAVRLLEMACAVRKDEKVHYGETAFGMLPRIVQAEDPVVKLQNAFFEDIPLDGYLRKPTVIIDGISGSAKSSVVRIFLRNYKHSAAIVTPTRKLAHDWRKHKLGTVTTKHKLTTKTLRGREFLIVDEMYAYTKEEMTTYLMKAAVADVRVILLGDRKQQYEDGSELGPEHFTNLGVPTLRMLVSNTMPVDSVKILDWAAGNDLFRHAFQTRSNVVHSIFLTDHNNPMLVNLPKDKSREELLVMKDRLQVPLGWDQTDEQLGFEKQKEEDWVSISRSQGSRTRWCALLCSKNTKTERWFAEQRGIFYVATSRHSKEMLIGCSVTDMNLEGLKWENWIKVDGKIAVVAGRERHDAPMHVVQPRKNLNEGSLIGIMMQRGMVPQLQRFLSLGPIREDWRPWPKVHGDDPARDAMILSDNLLALNSATLPFVETQAARLPHFRPAVGVFSLRRPNTVITDPIVTPFIGLNRLAVNQTSKDELLDLKNVLERTARPRFIPRDREFQEHAAEKLFEDFKTAFLDLEQERHLSIEPMAQDWIATRTTDFANKLVSSDPYGTTAYTTRSQGFLKTQVKVKVKRTFALEENYGQTVLASPPDFNAMFGPWSKMFLRNLRLMTRKGVIFDSGYSDKEVAREFRNLGVLQKLQNENYQADVKRQDTSHSPVTLKVFCKLLSFLGVPSDLCDLYEQHSSSYEYQSMRSGLYRGRAEYNLGSGDPFTLVRNIVQVATVMLERYGAEQLLDSEMIIKGDDFLGTRNYKMQPVTVPELRDTQLTEEHNKPPYHAGRFFLLDDVVPDPLRMLSKILVKPIDSQDRATEVVISFYDRYVPVSVVDRDLLLHYVRISYSDFSPSLCDAFVQLYIALRKQDRLYELLNWSDKGEMLRMETSETGCARHALEFFTRDEAILARADNCTVEELAAMCALHAIPFHPMTGRRTDLTRRGVWASPGHAWAIVGLTEVKLSQHTPEVDDAIVLISGKQN